MSTSATVQCTVSDGAAVLTLNRPDRLNAFTDRMEQELIDAFDRCDEDDAVQAVILTGAGRGFCAGMDAADAGDAFVAWRTAETFRATRYRCVGTVAAGSYCACSNAANRSSRR